MSRPRASDLAAVRFTQFRVALAARGSFIIGQQQELWKTTQFPSTPRNSLPARSGLPITNGEGDICPAYIHIVRICAFPGHNAQLPRESRGNVNERSVRTTKEEENWWTSGRGGRSGGGGASDDKGYGEKNTPGHGAMAWMISFRYILYSLFPSPPRDSTS
jgi:hypothetical protein